MSIRRERSDAAEHRRLILETAQSLFSEQGVQAVSMHQIAKTAGVGQGTLYRCYAHKGELCSDLVERISNEALQELDADLQRSQHLPAKERIANMLAHIIDFIDERCQLLMPIHIHQACEADTTFFRSALYTFLSERLTSLYMEANPPAEGGEPATEPASTKASVHAHIVLCSLNPIGYLHLRETCGFSKDSIVKHYCSLFAE